MRYTGLQAAIVDLDGTMIDTVGDFEVALGLALADLGWPPVGRAFISRTVGKGSEHLLTRTLAEVGAPAGLYEAAWARYQHHYLAINGRHSDVFPGVVEGLQALRAAGLRLACLTNKPNAFARPLLAMKGLRAQEARPAALAEDLCSAGHAAAAHADGGRQQQRCSRRARRRLPGGAGELRLQPR
jgi:phosphoglycolate phosphatase-like HAD superfamily hydrolase